MKENQNASRSRHKPELTLLSVVFCLLVIFIHVSSDPINNLNRPSWQLAAVYTPWKLASFVVYGFLFLGGVKLMLHPPEGDIKSILRYYKKRLFAVVIPYLVWVVVYYLWFYLIGYYEFSVKDLLLYMLRGNLSAHFYYIVVTVQFYLLAPVWIRLKRESAPFVLPFALLLTQLFNSYLPDILSRLHVPFEIMNDRVFTSYLFYWVAGCYAGLYYDEFCAYLKKKRVTAAVVYVLAAFPEVYCAYQGYAHGNWFGMVGYVHTIYICAAILFFFMLSLYAKELSFVSSGWFAVFGKASFAVYLSHLLIMNVWNRAASYLFPGATTARLYLFRILVTYAVSLTAGFVYVYTKQKISEKFKKA